MEQEDLLNKSEDFANIDDLLGDNDEDDDKAKDDIKVEEFVPQEGEDGFDNDCQNHGLSISVPHLRVKDEDDEASGVKKEKLSVFSSGLLDHILMGNTELVGAADIPTNLANEGITDVNKEDMERIREQIEKREMLEGLRAGLGQKKKAEMRMKSRMDLFSVSSAKAKTLAEKRSKLQDDILKFGVAAIEKFYPRQSRKSSHGRKNSDPRSAYRMKPVPHDMHFEEVEASKILKPYSHAKYIKQPEYSSVVYINRKDGLVPLSTLCKESKTLMSTNVNLLKGRNVRMGKPGHYVRDNGRLLAIGGTRHKHNLNIKIVKVPAFDKYNNKMPLFSMDDEFSSFAASAVHNKPSGKVDIREIKRRKKTRNLEIAEKISQEKSFLDQMMFKLNHKSEEDTLGNEGHYDSCMAAYKEFRERDKKVKVNVVETKENENDSEDIYKSFHIGKKDYLNNTSSTIDDSQEINEPENESKEIRKEPKNNDVCTDLSNEDSSDLNNTINDPLTVANKWESAPKTVVPQDINLDECPPLRGYHEGSIKTLVTLPLKLNFDGYTGYDSCDVSACFCKEGESTHGRSKNNSLTEFGTPVTGFHSGSQTPSGSKMRPQKIAKDLQRVKRALKTLGVKIIEFDEHDDCEDCLKDYCKLGCICDSLRTKQIPPAHCGKVDCMFSCCCSKEALKYSSCGSRRVNISAAVGARIQEDSQRHMAVEERKFSNTVVVTASKDAVMLGGRGTRRERKVPQRYQNANTLMLDVTGKEYVEKEVSSESDMEYEEEKQVDEYDRLRKAECLIPCTVILPMVSIPLTCSVWCMYHCQYSCPCYKFKNPLDYAPDVQTGTRNVAKRTLGNKFSTGVSRPVRKRRKSGEKDKGGIVQKASKVVAKKVKDDDTHDEEEALLGIEDIDPDWEAAPTNDDPPPTPQTSKVQHPATASVPKNAARKGHSARTRGLTIKGSSKTRLPYQPKMKESYDTNPDIPEMVEIISVCDRNDTTDKNADVEHYKNGKEKLEIATELSLDVAAKSSLQYVRWDLFKTQFESGVTDLWFWVRPGRGKNMVFLTKGGEKPYIATAINLRNLQGSTQNLPSLVAECIKVAHERDKGRYTVLESNGTVWTVKSLLAIKGGKEFDLSTDCSGDKGKIMAEKKEMEKVKVKDDGSIKISLSEPVQKLPVGQSLITVVEGPTQRAMMQVKLPPTLPSQYWSLISVGQGQSSIQCPDSTLVLKCAILQQAATLSTATSTTVRIPIPVGDQDPSFGVYAVPGLKSHVFVGPFASNEVATETIEDDDDDIVCLEDTYVKVKEEDDIKIIEPKKEIKSESELLERQKKRKLLNHSTKMRGQVPVVLVNEEDDDDIDIVGEVTNKSKSQAKDLKKQTVKEVTEKPLPYYRLKPSEFGKIVMRQTKRNEDSGSSIEIKHQKEGREEIFTAYLENSGKVFLTHPEYPDHDVICPNISSAKSWLDEHFQNAVPNPEEEVIFDDPKPLPAEPPRIKTPPPVLKRIKTPVLPSGKSTSNISLFLQTKQQKDEAELFYELGHTAFNNFFQRNVSRAQILVKAKDEVQILEEEGKKLEMSKQVLLKKRSKLFEDFTKTLNGLPVSRKKTAVIELKELLKKDKEQVKEASVEKQVYNPKADTVEIIEAGPSGSALHGLYPGQTPYTDITGIKTVRADGSILRPMNAFMLWAKERRSSMIAQGLSVSQVSQALSDQWRSMSEGDRSQFYKEAEHLKSLHRLQHPDYKFSPKTVRNTTTAHSPPPGYGRTQLRSPLPVSPNQPGDHPELVHHAEPNQPPSHPHGHIQVPKPLSQLRGQTLPKHQSLLLPRPKPAPRPTPGLIPVQHQGGLHTQPESTKSKQTHFEVLNIPSRPNIKISSTFTPRVPQLSISQIRRESVEEVMYDNQVGEVVDRRGSVEQLSRRQSVEHIEQGEETGTLNMQDIPQDAADVLGLAVQSSGLEEQEAGPSFYGQKWEQGDRVAEQQKEQVGHQQFVIQGGKVKQRVQSQEQQFIQIGGDNYQLVEQDEGEQQEGQQLVLNQEQAQQLLLAQQQGQQLLLEQEQLMMEQEEGQQLMLDPSQHVFVDEQGRQVILRPDQQMMLQNQQMVQLEGGQQVMQLEDGQQMMQIGEQQLMQLEEGEQMVQLESGQQMVQLEGEDGQRVMVAYQEHGDLLFQTQGEDLDME
eukprot:TRINITY_DN18135_c0_g1_i1.p1 TRINITY_DN18135_c0_g1~~TRINITY_DN18135_c0_g1_i1.p1  ORF type:complete len:2159 (-),score=869.91 TRINITY_DN18135_c0_g1_i1:100-6576(-)